VSSSFIFSDAFPGIGRHMTGKLRAAYAAVGKDARPYAYRPSLEYKTTSYGGYGYGFTGPNLELKPEFARSYEFGTELGFLNDRLGLDVTVYRKQTKDQIVNDIRGSYATGFILLNLNGADTRNTGLELTLRGTPILRNGFSWDLQANLTKARGIVLALPRGLPESYVSDTWLYGNIRNGTEPGLSTMSLTGLFYLRNKAGDLLIDRRRRAVAGTGEHCGEGSIDRGEVHWVHLLADENGERNHLGGLQRGGGGDRPRAHGCARDQPVDGQVLPLAHLRLQIQGSSPVIAPPAAARCPRAA